MPTSGLWCDASYTAPRRKIRYLFTRATATCFAAALLTEICTRPNGRQPVKARVPAINSNDYGFVDTPNAGFDLEDRN